MPTQERKKKIQAKSWQGLCGSATLLQTISKGLTLDFTKYVLSVNTNSGERNKF
jgi:hypothetical protein